MKIIYNSIIPFPGFAYMNLFGILFGRNEYKRNLTKRTLNHESIHTEQMKEMLYIFFYIWYLIEWLIKIPFSWFYKKKKCGRDISKVAYRSISFEQEAYKNQFERNYVENRKHYAWLKYLFKISDV
jgi:hypothetical protein